MALVNGHRNKPARFKSKKGEDKMKPKSQLIEEQLDAVDAQLERMKAERAPHEQFEKLEQKGMELFNEYLNAIAQERGSSERDTKEELRKFSRETFDKWIDESNEIRRKRAELNKELFTLETQEGATDEQLINLEVEIKTLNDRDLHLRDRVVVVLRACEWSKEELEYFDKRFFEEYHRSEGNNIEQIIASW